MTNERLDYAGLAIASACSRRRALRPACVRGIRPGARDRRAAVSPSPQTEAVYLEILRAE